MNKETETEETARLIKEFMDRGGKVSSYPDRHSGVKEETSVWRPRGRMMQRKKKVDV